MHNYNVIDITHWGVSAVVLVLMLFTKWSLSKNQNVTDGQTDRQTEIANLIIVGWLHATHLKIHIHCKTKLPHSVFQKLYSCVNPSQKLYEIKLLIRADNLLQVK